MATVNQSDGSLYQTQISQLLYALDRQRVNLATNLRTKGVKASNGELFNSLVPKVLKITAELSGVLISQQKIVDTVKYATLNPTSASDNVTINDITFEPFRLLVVYEESGSYFITANYHFDGSNVAIKELNGSEILSGTASEGVMGLTVTNNGDNITIGFVADADDEGYWMHPNGHYHFCVCAENSWTVMTELARLTGLLG